MASYLIDLIIYDSKTGLNTEYRQTLSNDSDQSSPVSADPDLARGAVPIAIDDVPILYIIF